MCRPTTCGRRRSARRPASTAARCGERHLLSLHQFPSSLGVQFERQLKANVSNLKFPSRSTRICMPAAVVGRFCCLKLFWVLSSRSFPARRDIQQPVVFTGSRLGMQVAKRQARRVHKAENQIPRGELDDVFRD